MSRRVVTVDVGDLSELSGREEVTAIAGDATRTLRDSLISMAGIVRRLKTSAAITGVYTPPEFRGCGYAGSVTAATVERIYAEENVAGAGDFGKGERKRQEDGVSRRNVRDGDAATDVVTRPILGDCGVAGKRGAAEGSKVDIHDDVITNAKRARDALRGLNLDGVALAVAKGHRVREESGVDRVGEERRGVETTAQKHYSRLST